MSYEDFEKTSEAIREENQVILASFEQWLSLSGLKDKTIRKHSGNVDFYINAYLLYDDCTHAKEGISLVYGFFNWFLPRKALWSSKAATKDAAASLKKFYKFLLEGELVTAVEYHELLMLIKQAMPEWLEQYDHECEW